MKFYLRSVLRFFFSQRRRKYIVQLRNGETRAYPTEYVSLAAANILAAASSKPSDFVFLEQDGVLHIWARKV